jgi:hypothetical protein
VSLTWTDNATNETGFAVERCTGVNCDQDVTNFVQIAAPGARSKTGSVTYVDATVIAGNVYSYRVKAVNGTASSGYTNTATAQCASAGVKHERHRGQHAFLRRR